jgi:phosphoglycerol transferase
MKTALKTVAGYTGAAALSLLLLAWTLRLADADLRVPLNYDGDALLVQSWVKGVLDNGWYLHNRYLGAPGGLDMHDFPLADALFLGLLKVIGLAAGEAGLTCNLFYLLTYPLVTLSALGALRRFGVSYGVALFAAVLYAFLPYHFQRGAAHLFLASYFLIPPLAVLALWLYHDGGVFFRRDEAGAVGWAPRSRRTLAAVGLCALAGSGGAYYAFFACYFLLVAALACAVRLRRGYPLVAAALLVGVITAGVLANAAPALLYARRHGPNPEFKRHPAQADLFGLKVAQLVLPVEGHRLPWLSQARARYSRLLDENNENSFASLGLAGSVGLLYLLARLLFRRPARGARLQDGLTVLTAAAVLLATVGGFGSLFNVFVTPWIRAYNRVSVFVGFFALFAVAVLLDRARARCPSGWRRWAFGGLLGLALVGGVLDQTSARFVPDYRSLKDQFDADAEFVGRLESVLPAGAMLFQLPSVSFPEADRVMGMASYDQFRAYLHSHGLRFSHGTMRGRPGDGWRARVAEKPLPELVRTLALAGFGGLLLERAGFSDHGIWLEGRLARLLGPDKMMMSRHHALSFFDLREYAERLRRRYTPAEWAALREEALHPVQPTWRGSFYPPERVGTETWHWAAEEGQLLLHNPLARSRKVTLSMNCATGSPGPAPLRLAGVAGGEWPIDPSGRPLTLTLELPPGEHALTFTCHAPRVNSPFVPRALVFRVAEFTLKDVAD